MVAKTFAIPKELIDVSLVRFPHSSMYGSYTEKGIILAFVKGYTPSQIQKIKTLRAVKGSFYETFEGYRRSTHKLAPLRELDTNDYALVLMFTGHPNNEGSHDYVLTWIKIPDLSV